MDRPPVCSLPFFSYGLFQPGQIGFTGLREFLDGRPEKGWRVRGRLLERDGLPLLVPDEKSPAIEGTLMRFQPDKQKDAYDVIRSIEPDKIYKWATLDAYRGPESQSVNLLQGLKTERGTRDPEWPRWDGRREPLFKEALEVVEDILREQKTAVSPDDPKPLIKLQMAYLLLWTAIERYTSFRYHLGKNVSHKIDSLASDPVFAAALKEVVKQEDEQEDEHRTIFRCDDPKYKETLDPSNPKKALRFYFQLRSNITHRGKAVPKDYAFLATSIKELLEIFKRVLKAEFDTH